MSNIIDKIRVSGTDYTLSATSSGGNPTVELTQAEYDALVSAGTVSADTYYIITDAQAGDLTNYYTKAETNSAITQATSGKVNTSSVVSSVTSASTDSEIPTAKAVFDAIPTGGTGGGKAISAGTNISVTTGETADTVSCTLPIIKGVNLGAISREHSVMIGYNNQQNVGYYIKNDYSASIGFENYINGERSVCLGSGNYANGYCSIAMNQANSAMTNNSVASGNYSKTSNEYEFASGRYNNSVSASTTFGDSGNTLFSVGNGTSSARHNAFEIRQNGDIYLSSGGTDIKLQDYLGGGGSSINVVQTTGSSTTDVMSQAAVTNAIPTVPTSNTAFTNDAQYATSGYVDSAVSGKADSSSLATVATSGSYNDLTNKPTIPTSTSAVTSGSTDVITSGGVYQQMGGLKLVKLTQSAYDALSPNYDANTIYFIKD